MAELRATGLRRCHVAAEVLLDVATGAGAPQTATAGFDLEVPDARVTFSLAVFFVPADGSLGRAPSDAAWNGLFDAGKHGLSVQGLESGQPETNRLLPVDNLFGRPSSPKPLPGDTYGWLISGRPDARTWRGRLKIDASTGGAGIAGRWIVRATCTDDTGAMTEEEWARVADRVQLRAARGRVYHAAAE